MDRKGIFGVIVLFALICFIVPTLIICEQDRERQQQRGEENAGRWLGVLSLGGMIIVIILGFRQVRSFLITRSRLTGRGVMRIHCYVAYVTFVLVIAHGILLSFIRKWNRIYSWWEFYPKLRTPTSWELNSLLNDEVFGIELGDWSFLTMILAVIGGYFFKDLLRKIGRKKTILFQQTTYVGLVLAVLHAKMDGHWTNKYPAFFYLQVIITIILLVGWGFVIQDNRRKRKSSKSLQTT